MDYLNGSTHEEVEDYVLDGNADHFVGVVVESDRSVEEGEVGVFLG